MHPRVPFSRLPVIGRAMAAVLFTFPSALAAEPTTFVERSDRGGVTVRLQFGAAEARALEVHGEAWQHVTIDGMGALAVPGWPGVPAYTALIAVPPDVRVTGVVATPGPLERRDGPPLLPALEAVPHEEGGQRTAGYRVEPAWSDTDVLYPEAWAELEGVSWWRNRRVAVVHVYPVRTVPGRRGFRVARDVTLSLSFAEGREPAGKPLVARYGDDPMDPTIEPLLLNGPESREWLRSERPEPIGRARGRRGDVDYFSSATTWVKVRARGEGILRVTGADLAGAGVSMPLDSGSLRVFVGPARELDFDIPTSFDEWLTEVAIRVEDGNDGTLDATTGERIELYAQSVDGFARHLDPASTDTTYTMHQYTNERVYWIAWGDGFTAGPPRRMLPESVEPVASTFTPVDRVLERLHIEENRIYDSAFKTLPTSEVSMGRWNKDQWEKWWWGLYSIADNSARVVNFQVPPHVDGTGRVRLRFFGETPSLHYLDLTLNTEPIPQQTWSGRNLWDVSLDASATPGYIRSGSNQLSVRIPSAPDRATDRVYFAYIEIEHERLLEWSGAPFAFDAVRLDGQVARYEIAGIPDAAPELYDVSDPLAPVPLTDAMLSGPAGDRMLTFERTESLAGGRRYHVTSASRHLRPVDVEVDEAPGGGAYLGEMSAPIDYIVIYSDEFESAGESLASFRRGYLPREDDPQVLAVKLSDVFDEFAGGMTDPSAVRRFLRFAYDNYRDAPTTPSLRFATLVGDADFDHRDFDTNRPDFFPAWSERFDQGLISGGWETSWPSDDYFGLLDDPTSRLQWIAVGRLPAATPGEAAAMVSKTIEHAVDSDRSPWFHRALFSADDLCQGDDWDPIFYQTWAHTRQCEEDLIPELPETILPLKVYLVDYPDPVSGLECTGTTKPSARDAFVDAINDGVFMLDYVGHGGESVMADERVLESADVASMSNAGRYHYFITASCTVGKFDDIGEGLGETVLKREGGGAVNSLSASAVAFAGANITFNSEFLAALFKGREAHPDSIRTFGEALVVSKALVSANSTNNTRKYNVMGDPANTVAWPANLVDLSIETAAPRGEAAKDAGGEAVEKAARADDRSRTLRSASRTRRSPGDLAPPTRASAFLGAAPDSLWRGEVATITGDVRAADGTPLTGYSGTARIEVYDSEELRHRDPYVVTGSSGGEVPVLPVDYMLRGAPIYRADVPVTNGQLQTSFFVPTGLRRGERGAARVICHVLGSGNSATDAFSTIENIFVPEDSRAGTSDDESAPAIELEFDGPAQAIPASSSVRIRFTDESGIYITQLLDSRSAVLTFEDAGGFVVSLIDLSPQIVFGTDYTTTEIEVPIPTSLEIGRPYILKVRASDNVGNRATVEEQIYLVVSSSPEVQRVFAFPNPATTSTDFFVDVNVAVDVELEIYTVTGRRLRTLETSFAAGEGRTRPLYWDLRDDDGDRVANGSYLYVMTVSPTAGGTKDVRQGWVAVLR